MKVHIHRAVVHDSHHLDPEHENHLYHEHVEVSSEELFFDLIFVAIGIELSTFLKKEINATRIAKTFGLFTTAWLTWFHMNMLLTRFVLPKIARVPVFLIMLGSLGMAVHAVNESNPQDPAISGFDNEGHILGIFLSLAIVRYSFFTLYLVVCYQIPLARPFISKYVICFFASGLLMIGAGVSQRSDVAIPLWIVAIAIEIFMYAFALASTEKRYRMSVNMEHALERNQLWVILILGESIISLVAVSHEGGFQEEYYFSVLCGFIIVYILMKLHIRSQLEYDVTADEHALESSAGWGVLFDVSQLAITAGMLGLAVGIKQSVAHSQDGLYRRSQAVLLTGSLGVTLLAMNLSRVCHKFAQYEVCGLAYGRQLVWFAHTAISLFIIPLGFLVENQDDDVNVHKNFPSAGLLVILDLILLVLLQLEGLLRLNDDEAVDDTWAHALTIGVQTDLSDFSPLKSRSINSLNDLKIEQSASNASKSPKPSPSPKPKKKRPTIKADDEVVLIQQVYLEDSPPEDSTVPEEDIVRPPVGEQGVLHFPEEVILETQTEL